MADNPLLDSPPAVDPEVQAQQPTADDPTGGPPGSTPEALLLPEIDISDDPELVDLRAKRDAAEQNRVAANRELKAVNDAIAVRERAVIDERAAVLRGGAAAPAPNHIGVAGIETRETPGQPV